MIVTKVPAWKKHYDKRKNDPEFRKQQSERSKKYYRKNLARKKEYNRAYTKRWQEENPERYKQYQRDYHLLSSYGLTFEEYQQMLQEREDKCDICKQVMSKPHVDHCHKTGEIRGLLCAECNHGLGKFGDDTERLLSAVAYLHNT